MSASSNPLSDKTISQYTHYLKYQRGQELSEQELLSLSDFQFDNEKFNALLKQSEQLRNDFYNKEIALHIHTDGPAGHFSGDLPVLTENGSVDVTHYIGLNPKEGASSLSKIMGVQGEISAHSREMDPKHLLSTTVKMTEEQYIQLAIEMRQAIDKPPIYRGHGMDNTNCILWMNELLKKVGIVDGLKNKFSYEKFKDLEWRAVKMQGQLFFDEYHLERYKTKLASAFDIDEHATETLLIEKEIAKIEKNKEASQEKQRKIDISMLAKNKILCQLHHKKELNEGAQLFNKMVTKIDKINEIDSAKTQSAKSNLKELGVKLNNKLAKTITKSSDVRHYVESIYTHIKKMADKKSCELKPQDLMRTAGFINTLGQFTNSKALCRIGTVTQASVQIGTSLLALKAATGITAAINPIAGISMAVLSIAGAFSKRKQRENDMLSAAIQSLALQINQIRQEMHERFNHIDNHLATIHLRIIYSFSEMHHQHKNMVNLLESIQSQLVKDQIEAKELFSTLNSKVQDIASMQSIIGRQEKMAKLYKNNNKAMGMHSLNASEFKDLFNKFTTEIMQLHKTDVLLVGRRTISPAVMVENFEADENNLFAADFNIATIQSSIQSDAKPTLVNPLIWSWQVIGMMELVKRFYEISEEAKNQISVPELKVLSDILTIGEETVNFSNQLKNTELLLQLNDEYLKAGRTLSEQLQKYIKMEEKVITNELNHSYALSVERPTHLDGSLTEAKRTIFDEFKKQMIPINVLPDTTWFTGRVSNSHYKWGEVFEGYITHVHPTTELKKEMADYKTGREQSIFKSTHETIVRSRDKLKEYKTHFHYFSEPFFELKYHNHFAFPHHPTDPILPLPELYQLPIPVTIQMAEWLKLGHIEFQYRIEDNRQNDTISSNQKANFILSALYVKNGTPHLISTLTSPYDPGIYTDEKDRREALWWYWVGGNCSRKGEKHYKTIYSHTTHESNTWRNYAYVPLPSETPGQQHQITLHDAKLINGIEHKYITEESDFINTVKNDIHLSLRENRKTLFHKIKKEISSNNDSELGKAFVAYSAAFYTLKSTLSLAYGDHNLQKYNAFNYFSDRTLLSTRSRFLDILENLADTDLSLIDLFNENLNFIESQIPLAFDMIAINRPDDSYLMFILKKLDFLIKWYEPTAINENDICSKITYEKMQQERILAYEGVFEVFKEAVLSCDQNVQHQLIQAIASINAKKDKLTWEGKENNLEAKRLEFFPSSASSRFFSSSYSSNNTSSHAESGVNEMKKNLMSVVKGGR